MALASGMQLALIAGLLLIATHPAAARQLHQGETHPHILATNPLHSSCLRRCAWANAFLTGLFDANTGGEVQAGQGRHSVPHGYNYEGEVTFTPTLQPGAAQGWSTMDAPLVNSSAAPAPSSTAPSSSPATVAATPRRGLRFAQTCTGVPSSMLLHSPIPIPHTTSATRVLASM